MSDLSNLKLEFSVTPVPFIKDASIRMATHDGEPLFIGKDVCQALGIKNHSDALSQLPKHLKSGVGSTDPHGRNQLTTAISEPGLYLLISKSRKKEAQKFMLWLCEDVLPQLRKHGTYITDGATAEQIKYALPNKIIEACKAHRNIKGKRRAPGADIIKMFEMGASVSIEYVEYIAKAMNGHENKEWFLGLASDNHATLVKRLRAMTGKDEVPILELVAQATVSDKIHTLQRNFLGGSRGKQVAHARKDKTSDD